MRGWAKLCEKLAFGLRSQGCGYLLRAPLNEFRDPRFQLTLSLRKLLVSMHDRLTAPNPPGAACPAECLVFVYDLGAAPITFDFASHLAAAEIQRRERGLPSLFVVFVPGEHQGVRRELPEYEEALSPATRLSRVRNLLIPMLALLPSVKGYVVCGARASAQSLLPKDSKHLYPHDYRDRFPRRPSVADVHEHARRGTPVWPLFAAPEPARRAVASFVSCVALGRKPLVITLRDNPTSPSRNSNFEAWRGFLDRLDRSVYAPILVYDTDALFANRLSHFANEVFCEPATWNLEMRLALYETAWLNLAVMHGAMELCWYSDRARYLCFLEPGLAASSRATAIRDNGIEIGANLALARPHQRIVWQGDSLATIVREFEHMVAEITGAARAEPSADA